MRILLAVLFFLSRASRLDACSCEGPGTPCHAAGQSAAAFAGTVVEITFVPAQFPVEATAASVARRLAGREPGGFARIKPGFRIVRMRLGEVLSGVAPGQNEIEIVTGLGDGDCGYPFRPGVEYVVYASKNAEGRLATSICSRTRPLAQAAEDLGYFEAMARAPATGEIQVRTGFADVRGKAGVSIIAERDGLRHWALTDAAGNATFADLPPGEYLIHAESDGDLPDDPKVQLFAKGCREVTLFRTLRIIGRVMTRDGLSAPGVEVQVRSTQETAGESRTTGSDGRYELRVVRPGRYYLGINLNHSPTSDTPYPRWFYPGTEEQAAAAIIDFSGKPDIRTYDFTLPDRQNERVIEGIVLMSEGRPMPRARVSVLYSSETAVAHEIADHEGRFALRVFVDVSYRLHAVWPGDTPNNAVSAVPIAIQPGSDRLSLRLVLTQQGKD